MGSHPKGRIVKCRVTKGRITKVGKKVENLILIYILLILNFTRRN